MPSVNGNFYRSAGQGYAVEKEKMKGKPDGGDSNSAGDKDAMKDGKGGDITKIKDHKDGKFSVKHADGEISKHPSADDMMAKLHEKFGAAQSDGVGDDEDSEGSDMMQSILG